MIPFQLSEEERRENVKFRLLAVVSSFGGQRIIAGPPIEDMTNKLADCAEQMARAGLLPGVAQPPVVTLDEDVRRDNAELSNRVHALENWIVMKGYELEEVEHEL